MDWAPDAFEGDDRWVSHTPAECQSRKNHCPPKVEAKQEGCYSSRDIGQDGTQVALPATPQQPNVGEVTGGRPHVMAPERVR